MDRRVDETRGPLGVLFLNLGSPDAPTTAALRRYLEEFLSDPLVVDLPRWRWFLIRRLFVLPTRSRHVAALYRRVWTSEGAPLVVNSRHFVTALGRELGAGFVVAMGMRCGSPSIEQGLEELRRAGCERILLFPAFPQSSRTTTGTAVLEAGRVMKRWENVPALRVAAPYFAERGYIEALATRVREALSQGPVDHYVFSFHGLPVRYVEAGDPYRDQCVVTARALAEELRLAEHDWTLVYQSRFGREPWLEPNAAELVPTLAAQKKRVLLTAPSFTADCLETLEELALRLRESFLAAGGTELRVVPCLNDHPTWVGAAARLVRAVQ